MEFHMKLCIEWYIARWNYLKTLRFHKFWQWCQTPRHIIWCDSHTPSDATVHILAVQKFAAFLHDQHNQASTCENDGLCFRDITTPSGCLSSLCAPTFLTDPFPCLLVLPPYVNSVQFVKAISSAGLSEQEWDSFHAALFVKGFALGSSL